MKCLVLILILHELSKKQCLGNYTFTYHMAAQCKEYKSQQGYKYETLFSVDDNTKTKLQPGVQFEMHIAILAPSNGHVLLSSVAEPGPSDPVYEIVIGGGGNRFTELRRNLRSNSKSTMNSPGILSPIEYRPFYIKVSEDGFVELGKEGDTLPLLHYHDLHPIQVKYFSFTSWKGVEAIFLYDCPVALENGTEVDSKTNSQEVEKKIPVSEKLRKSLMLSRPYNMPPSHEMTIKTHVVINDVKYNEFTTQLITTMVVILQWIDEGLSWNPYKYNGTTKLNFLPGQLWKPSFIEASTMDGGPIDSRSLFPIVVNFNGEVVYLFETRINSWCDTQVQSKWPNDEYTCLLIFESWHTHDVIKLKLENATDLMTSTLLYTNDPEVIIEWKITQNPDIVERKVWDILIKTLLDEEIEEDDFFNDNVTLQSDKLIISLKLRRNATAHNIVFYIPLLVLMVFLLMSFWTKPLTMDRVWFYMGTTICICLGLSYIDYLVPCHTLPSILILYTTVLAGTLLALMVQVTMMQGFMDEVHQSRFVQNLLTLKVFRLAFCLPEKKVCKKYEAMSDELVSDIDEPDYSEVAPTWGVEQMQNENNPSANSDKDDCAMVIDKIMTVIYTLTFVIMLANHY